MNRFKKNRIDVISMGCSKNLVDSERLMKQLVAKGYSVTHDPEYPCGEHVVVNTCGFIGDAKEESINLILRLAELKKEKRIGSLTVMGCLPVRYFEALKTELPEVDRWYGKFDWNSFIMELPVVAADNPKPETWERILTTPAHSAYIKISEGCDRFCAYCAIPYITGRHKSRTIDEILKETVQLAGRGVKEFNVIAQDLSSYGQDVYGRPALAELIDRMADVDGVEWIRLHYAYPKDFPYDVLDVMTRRDNVCKYLDIAFQHISDNVLDRMLRHFSKQQTLKLIDDIRSRVPDIRLRTTLMVGFPGESEKDFEELKDFVKATRFDRMGAFAYCEEDGTFASVNYKDDIPETVKRQRLEEIMELQREISYELQQSMIGKKVKVLIDVVTGNDIIGRTQFDSPEVDPEVHIIPKDNIRIAPGDFINVIIDNATEYDLSGHIA